ncbi:MAG: hypothetical protein HQ579_08360, partial [Candidatus Omnitrophica bacterium]|nr:hypothetical protein [Candidatus Omnitrophota bacterium]
AQDDTLAAELRTKQDWFKKQFLAGEILVLHRGLNAHIEEEFESGGTKRDGTTLDITRSRFYKKGLLEFEKIEIASVPEILKFGQYGHVGLGRAVAKLEGAEHSRPTIYFDSRYYYDEDVRLHEIDEIVQWELLRMKLGLKSHQMRDWIKKYFDKPCEALKGTECEELVRELNPDAELTSANLAEAFHKRSHKLPRRLLKKGVGDVNFSTMLALYAEAKEEKDVNIGAVIGKPVKKDYDESLSVDDIGAIALEAAGMVFPNAPLIVRIAGSCSYTQENGIPDWDVVDDIDIILYVPDDMNSVSANASFRDKLLALGSRYRLRDESSYPEYASNTTREYLSFIVKGRPRYLNMHTEDFHYLRSITDNVVGYSPFGIYYSNERGETAFNGYVQGIEKRELEKIAFARCRYLFDSHYVDETRGRPRAFKLLAQLGYFIGNEELRKEALRVFVLHKDCTSEDRAVVEQAYQALVERFGITAEAIEQAAAKRIWEAKEKSEIISLSKEWALELGNILKERQKQIESEDIAPNAHTPSDDFGHNFLVKKIKERFSGHNILSEEEDLSGEWKEDAPYTWILDPLCGSKEFKAKRTNFSVGIICIDNRTGMQIVGLSYAPCYGTDATTNSTMFYAGSEGTYVNEQKRVIPTRRSASGKAIIVKHRTLGGDPLLPYRERLKGKFSEITTKGGSLTVQDSFLAKQDTDCIIHMCKLTDVLPRAYLVQQAGGRVSFIDGTPVFPLLPKILLQFTGDERLPPVLYSRADIHDEILKEIRDIE